MNRYVLRIFDIAGLYDERRASSFEHLLNHCRAIAADKSLRGKAVVRCFNDDNCDVDSNGLTADENELIDEVLSRTPCASDDEQIIDNLMARATAGRKTKPMPEGR